MASPFRYFRKHRKAFLAVAAVLAMFIFVIGGALSNFGGGPTDSSGRSLGAMLASWDGGSMTGRELDMLTQRRYFISEFLSRLQQNAAFLIQQEGGTPLAPAVPSFFLSEQSNPRDVQMGVITTRILSEQAQASGMSVSDDVINNFLVETGLRRMGNQEITDLLRSMGQGGASGSVDRLFSGLRELLLGNMYFNSYFSTLSNVMPEEKWQDWRRINDRIAVEAAIVPAAQLVAKVTAPTDGELQAFYEEYKDALSGSVNIVFGAQLPSPTPGFREPRRVRVEYLLGDLNAWTQKLLDSVTEEAISDYYQRNKRTQFVKMESSVDLLDEEDSLDEAVGELMEDVGESQEEENSEVEVEEEAADENNESSAEPDADESSDGRTRSPFQFAVFQTEEGEPVDTPEDSDSDVDQSNSSGEEADEEEEFEYEPLEDVSDQIRRILATDKAVLEMKDVVEATLSDLQKAYNPYGYELVEAKSDQREPAPPPQELADLAISARETGLAHEMTVLLSRPELADTFVGKAIDARTRNQFVWSAAFGELGLYEPFLAQDLDGNWYIVLKVEDVPTRVPEFDEIRQTVLAAWKGREAAKLALQEAETLAQQAQEAGGMLAQALSDYNYEMVTTDLFSWLSFGTTAMEMQRGPRLGEAPPLEAVGSDFMAEAFELGSEQRIAVLSHDEKNAYVLRLDRRELTQKQLREKFLSEANNWYGGRMMSMTRFSHAQRLLLGQLMERVGLDLEKLEAYFKENTDQ